jgi:BppU N-terminal domain
MKKVFQITLDLVKSSEIPKISIKESDLDSIQFIFKVLNNGEIADLTGATVQLAVKKPSLLTSYEDCVITDAIAGICEVILSNQSYLEIGTHVGELYITQNAEVTVTNSFEYASLDAIMSDNTLLSENNWQALHDLLIANGQRPILGEGDPNGIVTSEFGGQFYLDTLNDLMYFAPNEALSVWSPLVGGGGGDAPVNWDSILDKPTEFPPSAHSHLISEVTGLQTNLDSKQPKPESVTAIPTKTPAYLGEISIDGTNGRTYIAEGVTSDKWKRLATTTYVDTADNYIITTLLSGLSFWKGTQAQYTAIVTKSPTTLYFITG